MAGQEIPQNLPPAEDEASRPSVIVDVAADLAVMSLPDTAFWLISLPFRLLAWLIGGLLSALG